MSHQMTLALSRSLRAGDRPSLTIPLSSFSLTCTIHYRPVCLLWWVAYSMLKTILKQTNPYSVLTLCLHIGQALSCMVQVASVRRSLFSNTERAKFLTHLVNGVKHILQNPQGLSDASNYHEFCRLLARLKSNYQLGELVMVDTYPEAIQLIAKFSVESLQVNNQKHDLGMYKR